MQINIFPPICNLKLISFCDVTSLTAFSISTFHILSRTQRSSGSATPFPPQCADFAGADFVNVNVVDVVVRGKLDNVVRADFVGARRCRCRRITRLRSMLAGRLVTGSETEQGG